MDNKHRRRNINPFGEELISDAHLLPAAAVGEKAGDSVKTSDHNPTATIGTALNVGAPATYKVSLYSQTRAVKISIGGTTNTKFQCTIREEELYCDIQSQFYAIWFDLLRTVSDGKHIVSTW
ncbi:hypothetical protein V6N13_054045 [Hibiscus sabdariffa]|uniref:Uncharacterized protein n=2 Tax=Hibiscus sabdariffa TaxID=183260 RepID=A0ABR1ZXK1_9ROSI